MFQSVFSLVLLLFFLCGQTCAQKGDKDHRKENYKSIGRPGDNYTYTSGSSEYNPATGKHETVEGKWKKQPDEYQYNPRAWRKPKHKSRVYGKNPLKRLFKMKPKSAKPSGHPSDKEAPFTTGDEEEKKKKQ